MLTYTNCYIEASPCLCSLSYLKRRPVACLQVHFDLSIIHLFADHLDLSMFLLYCSRLPDCQVDSQLCVQDEAHHEHIVLLEGQVLLVSQEQFVPLGQNIFLYHSVGEHELEVLHLALE